MASTMGATFMKFGRAPTTLMTLSIKAFGSRRSAIGKDEKLNADS
jgi:hypothetical protein